MPSFDNDTAEDRPDDSSPAASPSMSSPSCVHAFDSYRYTRTCPALVPVPSFRYAPTATIFPSPDTATTFPEASLSASP
eukprot:30773-Pelagococcus_subviridis.AAC.4